MTGNSKSVTTVTHKGVLGEPRPKLLIVPKDLQEPGLPALVAGYRDRGYEITVSPLYGVDPRSRKIDADAMLVSDRISTEESNKLGNSIPRLHYERSANPNGGITRDGLVVNAHPFDIVDAYFKAAIAKTKGQSPA